MTGDVPKPTEVEPAYVVVQECGHPALATRTEPKPWAPRGELQYLPCAICRAETLEQKLAVVAMHATGQCHCRTADDCHSIINKAVAGEKIGDAGVRLVAIDECVQALARACLPYSTRSDSAKFGIVQGFDEAGMALRALKDVE